eukprot:1093112-Amphidinium_carterae.1
MSQALLQRTQQTQNFSRALGEPWPFSKLWVLHHAFSNAGFHASHSPSVHSQIALGKVSGDSDTCGWRETVSHTIV